MAILQQEGLMRNFLSHKTMLRPINSGQIWFWAR